MTTATLDPVGFDWTCIGHPQEPPAVIPKTVTYTFPMVEWPTDNLLSVGRTVRVCGTLSDLLCSQLLSTVHDSGDHSDISVLLAQNARFLLLEADGYVPMHVNLSGPPFYADWIGGKIQMVSTADVAQFAPGRGAVDPNLGIVETRAYDCQGKPVTGALFSTSDRFGYPFTFVQGIPQVSASPAASTTIPTDESQWAGFVNDAVGDQSIVGMDGATKQVFGQSSAAVGQGEISVVELGRPPQ